MRASFSVGELCFSAIQRGVLNRELAFIERLSGLHSTVAFRRKEEKMREEDAQRGRLETPLLAAAPARPL